jgi:hypothetical protein
LGLLSTACSDKHSADSDRGKEIAVGGEVAELKAEIERLIEGSAWRQRILGWLMEAETDGRMKELVDEQTRRRMRELCRTEECYFEICEALTKAGLEVKDGTLVSMADGSLAADQLP